MMLFKHDKIYVNKSDVRFLLTNYKDLNVPEEITDSLAGISDDPCTVVDSNGKVYDGGGMCFDDGNGTDWVGFSNQICKDYFEAAKYMIDYEEYLTMSDEQIDRELDTVLINIQNIKNYSDCLNYKEKQDRLSTINMYIDMLGHKYLDIITMKNVRNNYINIPLPPDELVTDNGPTGPVKVAKKDMKHVWFAEKYVFNFNVQDIYRYTNIK